MKPLIEITADKFGDMKKSKYFLLDFYSTECPNCEKLKPILELLNGEFHEKVLFTKIFRQNNRALAESLDVFSSPTVLFFVDGEEVFRMSGQISKQELKENIQKNVSQ